MYWYNLREFSHGKRLVLVLGALALSWLMVGGGGKGSVISAWRGDQAAAPVAAGLVGQAALIGRGDTLVAPDQVAADEPWGNPVIAGSVLMTQGYAVGSHAPAETWGAIDMAVDGDGDGVADPAGSWGAPIRATMSGRVQIARDSWPAGNHVWVIGERYKTGYAHLQEFAVEDGQFVERGTIIGFMGSSGSSSGPHLHYHIWLDGVNQNPLEYHPLP